MKQADLDLNLTTKRTCMRELLAAMERVDSPPFRSFGGHAAPLCSLLGVLDANTVRPLWGFESMARYLRYGSGTASKIEGRNGR